MYIIVNIKFLTPINASIMVDDVQIKVSKFGSMIEVGCKHIKFKFPINMFKMVGDIQN